MAQSLLRSPNVKNFSVDFFIPCKLHQEKIVKAGLCGDIVLVSNLEKADSKLIVKKFSLLNEEKRERNKRMFDLEIKFMQSLDHPFIARCIFAATCPGYSAICMKYYSRGTLSRHVGKIDLDMSELCIIQVACGLRYLHKNKLVHLDVKLSNVFLDQEFNAVLGDFGLAVEMKPKQQTLAKMYIGGTPGYFSPEWKAATRDMELDPYKLDSYSLGVTLWCLVFERRSGDNINYYYETRQRRDLKPNIRDMLLRLLERNTERRATIPEFLYRVRRESVYRQVIDKN